MNAKTFLFVFGFVFVIGAALAGILLKPIQETPTQDVAALPQLGQSSAANRASENVSPAQNAGTTKSSWGNLHSLIDRQGAVSVEVIPLNFENPGPTLEFSVSMNTHSVDLSMDLAELATLTIDTGVSAQALQWNAPRGGHHVSGTLSFPAEVDGISLVREASTVTLVIADVDAPERVFVWER